MTRTHSHESLGSIDSYASTKSAQGGFPLCGFGSASPGPGSSLVRFSARMWMHLPSLLQQRVLDVSSYNNALDACEQDEDATLAADLIDEMWASGIEPNTASYEKAIRTCRRASIHDKAEDMQEELDQWGLHPDWHRFDLVPAKEWHRDVKKMGCSAHNTCSWTGRGPVPKAPMHGVWLLPASDDLSMIIAERQRELRAAGWRLMTCEPRVVHSLGNKAALREYAEHLGLLAHLPQHFESPESATYPCVLKPAVGEYGFGNYIVESAEEVRRITKTGFGSKWLLQELILGPFEYAVSLLVHRGQIVYSIGTEYEYGAEAYVWPRVEEIGRNSCEPLPSHLATMQAFVREFNGILNFNYKLTASKQIKIFEVNTRIGSDLGCDVPRAAARTLLEKLDSLQP